MRQTKGFIEVPSKTLEKRGSELKKKCGKTNYETLPREEAPPMGPEFCP